MLFAFFCFGISRTVAYPSLQNRIKSDVCAKYQSLYIPKHQGPCHIPGKSPCSIGRHEEQDFNDAVNAINFFRYLNGLDFVKKSTNAKIIREENEAAMVMNANNKLTQSLDKHMKCYKSGAATGARNSILAKASPSVCASRTITRYMLEANSTRLSHRRWILDPKFSEVAIGVVGKYSALRINRIPKTGKTKPAFIAYPPPGPVPDDLIPDTWSFSNNHNMLSDAKVTVKCNGESIPIVQQMNFGIVNFKPERLPEIGEMFEVEVKSSKANTTWKYTVTPVSCSAENGLEADFESNEKKSANLSFALIISAGVAGIAVIALIGYVIVSKKNQKQYVPI